MAASVAVEGADDCGVARITLNRPSRGNAMDQSLFSQLVPAFRAMDSDPAVRVVLLCGAGPHFCTGIDLSSLSSLSSSLSDDGDGTRSRERLRQHILELQAAVSSPESCCRKPVVAVIHGACIGGGVDLATACDLRYCTKDARFSVREAEVGITADLGSLQRLPTIVGHGRAMDLALTARTFGGDEAATMGLVSGAFDTREELYHHAMLAARGIASRSPLAIAGTKAVLLRSRDMSVAQGLDFVATWNSAMLSRDDIQQATTSRSRSFAKL